MNRNFRTGNHILFFLLFLLILFCTSCGEKDIAVSAVQKTPTPTSAAQPAQSPVLQKAAATPTPIIHPVMPPYLNGKTASLSWINGGDCQEGINAYLRTADSNPNAALVGTAWVNPLYGNLLEGYNNCIAGSSSMDNVVELIHSKGGMAYLTVTMATEGPGAWSFQRGAEYVVAAMSNQGYIDTIVQAVLQGGYDGAIMDLEGIDHRYPSIQQTFAAFNTRVWDTLQAAHKWYGLALVHKISDHDVSYDYNGFANWKLLANTSDFIVIMAVDQSRLSPGPCVSIAWLRQLLDYTLRNMPSMLPRIIWEIPLYANSWHWEQHGWVYDDGLTYQGALEQAQQIDPARIDEAASNREDYFYPHLVYTDEAGVKHALWYPTVQGLYVTLIDLWEMLLKQSEFTHSRLQVAVWWRTTQEPTDFWPLLDSLNQ